MSVSKTSVEGYLRARDVRLKAAEHGIVIPESFSSTPLSLLLRHQNDIPVFKAMAQFVANRSPKGQDIVDLNLQIKQATSEDQRLAVINKISNSMAIRKRSVGKRAVSCAGRSRLFSAITKLENLVAGKITCKSIQLSRDDSVELQARVKGLSKRLLSILTDG
jgi:hypothetical protein